MTRKTNMTGELVWEHATHDIPQSGLSREREAAPDELARIARALDLIACASLRTAYTIMPTVGGRFRLSGRLRAEISQACVVTLEPVDSTDRRGLRRDVLAGGGHARAARRRGRPGRGADPEPIVAGQIDVGRVVFECLAAGIDPVPEKARRNARPALVAAADGGAGKPESPFAVLANLKTRA